MLWIVASKLKLHVEDGPWGRDKAWMYMQVKVKENGERMVDLPPVIPVQREFQTLKPIFL